MPPAKLTAVITAMSTKNPTLLSDRCGVSSAEKSVGSAAAAAWALLSLMRVHYMLHGAQNEPQAGKENPQETEIRQAQTLGAARGRGGVPSLQESQPGAEDRTRAHQSLHAAGRSRPLRAGDGRRRQQGDARAVRRRRYARENGRARRG